MNDSPIAIEALRRVIAQVPDYQIAWVAQDGEEAVRSCAQDTPDILLMDLMMPQMDGVEATRLIMQNSPCAILVVTATVGGHSSKVFEAMGWGALDAVNTPVLDGSGRPHGPELLAKIAVLRKLIGKPREKIRPLRPPETAIKAVEAGFPLVAIGASTGGPSALARLLADLPSTLRASIVIVQHVDKVFAPGYGFPGWAGRRPAK